MKKATITIIILAIVGVAGFFAIQNKNERAKAAKLEAEILKGLTADEIAVVLKSEAKADRGAIEKIVENQQARQNFLKAMREYLALAAQARREGLTEDENHKINLEYKKNILLADLYKAELSQGKNKIYVVSEDQKNAVWASVENKKGFDRDTTALLEIQKETARANGQMPPSPLEGVTLEKARDKWAETKILSDMARADSNFMNQPEIDLRMKILEAGILSADYLRANAGRFEVSDAEIKEYLAAHPEFSPKKKLEKAQTVLQKLKNGEDFTKLASLYSEDRASKEKGGLYEEIAQQSLWQEVAAALSDMEKGQTSDRLIESQTGYHIVKLIDKKIKKNATGSEELNYKIGHILIQKKFEEPGNQTPGVPPPFMTGEEIAKSEIAKKKRTEFVENVIRQNPVSLPEDFSFELQPEIKKDSAVSDK